MSYYKFPDLSADSIRARLKRIERTVQYQKGGMQADAGAKFRTVAASAVDRDGHILASALVGSPSWATKQAISAAVKAPATAIVSLQGQVVAVAGAAVPPFSGGTPPTLTDISTPGGSLTWTDPVSGVPYIYQNINGIMVQTPLDQ